MTRYWRLFSIVAALPWWLAVAGHTQESTVGCSALGLGRGCQTTHQTSLDSNKALVPSVPSRPIVTYTKGKLTVTASNTSLAQVLRAISAQTGTVIDFPAGSAADRIVVREGPDTIGHVLANLLNGSGFNYVILASPNAPDQLMRVVLVKADQPASLSSQSARNQGSSTPEQPKTIGDPLLWAPDSDSLSWTPPEEDPSAAASTKMPDGESVVTPKDPILPDALEQMMKERTRQLREQAQPPQ